MGEDKRVKDVVSECFLTWVSLLEEAERRRGRRPKTSGEG